MIDHQRLLGDIDAEVRRRRAADPAVAALEEELESSFAPFAPAPAGVGHGFGAALARADDAAYVDARPPIASPRAAVRRLKGLVHRAVSWEVRHVAVQVSAFACTITEAVRLLGERVDALERAGGYSGGPTGATAAFHPPAEPWAAVVAGLVGDPPGAVALVGCPALAAGLEAVGIETVATAAAGAPAVSPTAGGPAAPPDAGGEAPPAPPTGGPPAALPGAGPLGAVVVSGPAARRPPGALAALAREAAGALAPGGTVVVLDADPVAWAAGRSPVEADLAGPRPLHPASWRLLLADAGLADHGGVTGGPAYAVAARRPTAP